MQVTVRIEDVNDNPPVISSTSGPTSLSLLESTPTGTILSVVSATDVDVGDNAHIRYDITSGNDAGNKFHYISHHVHRTYSEPSSQASSLLMLTLVSCV